VLLPYEFGSLFEEFGNKTPEEEERAPGKGAEKKASDKGAKDEGKEIDAGKDADEQRKARGGGTRDEGRTQVKFHREASAHGE
jgi:hypothetical protein